MKFLRVSTAMLLLALVMILGLLMGCELHSGAEVQATWQAGQMQTLAAQTQGAVTATAMTVTASETPAATVTQPKTPAETATVENTPTFAATETPDGPGVTVTPSALPTTGPQPTPTQIVTDPFNLSKAYLDSLPTIEINGGFEDEDGNPKRNGTRPVIFPEVNVYDGWNPFYCDQPYTQLKCVVPASWNPPPDIFVDGVPVMKRPEYKPTDITGGDQPRVFRDKTAQQWFCYFGVCNAGVYQTVNTVPGSRYVVSAWVETWSAATEIGTDGIPWHSDNGTLDQQNNSRWYINVDLTGGTNAFASSVSGVSFGYSLAPFDRFVEIRYLFTATGPKTTVFIGNARRYALAHNDNYLDEVHIYQLDGNPVFATPTPQPSATAVVTPTQAASPGKDPSIAKFGTPRQFASTQVREIHSDHNMSAASFIRNLDAGEKVTAYFRWDGPLYSNWPGGSAPPNDEWLCIDDKASWQPNPDRPLEWPQILKCGEWIALSWNGSWLLTKQ